MTSARTRWPSKPTTTTSAPNGCSACTRPASTRPRALSSSTTEPRSAPTASSWRRARGHGRGPARNAWPECTCCAPSTTPSRCVTNCAPGARLVVIGAGFIGAEVASTAAKLGLDVTVVEAALAPLAGPLGVQLGAAVARLHTEHGTRLLCGAPVAGLTGSDRVTGVVLGRRASARRRRRRCRHRRHAQHRVAARQPDSSSPTALSATRAGQPRSRMWSRSATARPGTSRPSAGRTASSTGPARWSARPSRSPRCSRAGGTTARLPKPPYFWSDQYGRRIQFAGIADPGDEITFEVGGARDASFLAVYRRDGRTGRGARRRPTEAVHPMASPTGHSSPSPA